MDKSLPVIVLKEGTKKAKGLDVMRNNILVAATISEMIKPTLGPTGMDKMILGQKGDAVITNDGATILKEINPEHPAVKIMVELAKAQDSVAGDGTKMTVVFAGELLKKAQEYLDAGLHPSIIASGFSKASRKAIEVLKELAFQVTLQDERTLEGVARTAMSSKSIAGAEDHLAHIVVDAIKGILEKKGGELKVDLDSIKIEKQEGKSLKDTFHIDGVAVNREITHPAMPKYIGDARIALIERGLEVKEIKGRDFADVKLAITAPSQIKGFTDKEKTIIKDIVEKIKASGANVAIINRGMDDLAVHYLAEARIPAWKRVFKPDMEKIARITGGKLIQNPDELTPETLGYAKVVEERKIGKGKYLLVRVGKNRKATTIFVRGGTKYVVEEAERGLHDALCVVRDSLEDAKAIVGGGAAEMEISKHLREFVKEVSGREQLAIEAFAKAIETIPKALAENSGLDATDIVTTLKSEHNRGNKWAGVDISKKATGNMKNLEILEPLRVKVNAVKSATEAAVMILRIDDAFFAKRTGEKPPKKFEPEEEYSE
jgi:thermosome